MVASDYGRKGVKVGNSRWRIKRRIDPGTAAAITISLLKNRKKNNINI